MSRLNYFFEKKFIYRNILVVIFFLFCYSNVYATRNTSRYFPFLERTESYILKGRSHIAPALFFTRASGAYKRGGGDTGIPELYGSYDLKDIICSLQAVQGSSFVNPIEQERGPNDIWLNKSIVYKVGGKLKSVGLTLPYEQILKYGFSAGFFLPVMHVNGSCHFNFSSKDSDSVFNNLRIGEYNQLDRIRRSVNEDLDLNGGNWSKTGIGDLDLHLKFDHNWKYVLLMRRIDLAIQAGVICPTGTKSDNKYASSVSFMGDGHWGMYLDAITELELKRGWKAGFLAGFAYQFGNTRKLRIPVYQENALFSALIRDVKTKPGITFKLSPYAQIDNFAQGFNFQFRYTFLKHNADKYYDNNSDSTVQSYLQRQPGTYGSYNLTEENISENKAYKSGLTRWSEHYLSFELSYDSLQGGNNWFMDPVVFALLDYQVNGNSVCKTHQFSLGVELHF
ncbi:hypothetical protein K9M16_01160 [Candidatus Babeliales bacterium]|nr:hypothetical protein [Candidatus Babeliales bacterium]